MKQSELERICGGATRRIAWIIGTMMAFWTMLVIALVKS